jgi:CelD/BcsL family acetyltransferase involved in cellulose biosynthesis
MRVVPITTLSELERLQPAWNGLAGGIPFRMWQWLVPWWRHYGRGRHLYVLAVYDEQDVLQAIAPWMRESSIRDGRVLRLLGTGDVCSDYLGLLTSAGSADRVAQALASWLTEKAGGRKGSDRDFRWDLLELEGVDAEDEAVTTLIEQLRRQGNAVHCRSGPQCWRIPLPASWDDYLARLSKSHRKKLRRLERNGLNADQVRLHRFEQSDGLPAAMAILVDLHQRRFRGLGEPGCFASAEFTGFLQEAAEQMAMENRLRLYWIEWEGRPIAVEFQLLGDGVVYAYQAGMNPDRLDLQPGRLSCIAGLKQAIAEGRSAFDFLRGDESFKAHWGATPRPSLYARIAPRKSLALARHVTWLAGRRAKDAIKGGLAAVGLRRGSRSTQGDKESPLQRVNSNGGKQPRDARGSPPRTLADRRSR